MYSINEIVEDIRKGKMVIIMDDEDRENEGDLLIAASKASAEDINFMARYGRGLICLTLTQERCEQLDLPLMVSQNGCSHSTNFTMSINATEGVIKGASAADRAKTIQAAVAADARPADITQPGHIFPLMAKTGGVLTRAGHTEAGCDLARLADLEPAAVIVEILNEDGTMARRPELEKFAKEHNIKIGTIADLIEYRIQNEQTIERKAVGTLPTEFGEFDLVLYEDNVSHSQHFALLKGEVDTEIPSLVRVHVQNPIRDLTSAIADESGWTIQTALQRISEEGNGVVVVLQNQFSSTDTINMVNNFENEIDRNKVVNIQDRNNMRTIGLGAQIVKDLGVQKMRVLGSSKKMPALSGFGLEVIEFINNNSNHIVEKKSDINLSTSFRNYQIN
jgi:3,4-dihydroxy 2-butanone 4-phosphate synthase / GTP cyclohydrolase II